MATLSCPKAFTVTCGCPVPAAFAWTAPNTTGKHFEIADTIYLPAYIPGGGVLVPPDDYTVNCMDMVDFVPATPVITQSYAFPGAHKETYAAQYEPSTGLIVALVRVGGYVMGEPGPFFYIAFFNTLGVLQSSTLTNLNGLLTISTMLMRGHPGKVAFAEESGTLLVIANATTKTITELTVPTGGSVTYCCTTHEFARSNANKCRMINADTGVQTNEWNVPGNPTYIDSTSRIILVTNTSDDFRIMNPATGVVSLTQIGTGNRNYFAQKYNYKLNALALAAFDRDAWLPIFKLMNVTTLASIKEVQPSADYTAIGSSSQISCADDSGNTYFTQQPGSQWIHEIKPI